MLLSLALIFLCGMILGKIFSLLKLPSLLGLIITGIILGPYCFNLLDDSILSISADLRELALIIILTRAGLNLDIEDLKKVGRPAILMCFVPATFEIIGMILIAPKLFDISLLDAALMGSVVAAVSPAVLVPKMLKLIDERYGTNKSIPQLLMAGASVDDIFVIVLFASFTSLVKGGTVSALGLDSVVEIGDSISIYDNGYVSSTYSEVTIPGLGTVESWSNDFEIAVGQAFFINKANPSTWTKTFEF